LRARRGLPGERVADHETRFPVGESPAAALDHRRGQVEAGVARLHAARAQPGEEVAEAAADVEHARAVEVAERGERAEALLLRGAAIEAERAIAEAEAPHMAFVEAAGLAVRPRHGLPASPRRAAGGGCRDRS